MATNNIGILYNQDELSYASDTPFGKKAINDGYEQLSRIGLKYGIEFVFAKPSNYKNKRLSKGWIFANEQWQKVTDVPVKIIYDKFKFTRASEKLRKQISKQLLLVNNLDIERLCKDKWLMYKYFASVSVPTYKVHSRRQILNMADTNSWSRVVLKPRFGVGGVGIYIGPVAKIPNRIPEQTLAQPFIESRKNPVFGVGKAHDIRVIVINGKIDHAYIRAAEEGLRSNVALGGRVHHIPNSKLPKDLKDDVKRIDKKIAQYKPRIYTADFLVDKKGKAWLGEMNSQPAMYLYFGKEGKKVQAKFFANLCKALKNAL